MPWVLGFQDWVPLFHHALDFKITFAAPTFRKKYLSPFEHANLIFAESWALANEIMLNIIQNYKVDFLEDEFWADWGVRFKFYFQNLT